MTSFLRALLGGAAESTSRSDKKQVFWVCKKKGFDLVSVARCKNEKTKKKQKKATE